MFLIKVYQSFTLSRGIVLSGFHNQMDQKISKNKPKSKWSEASKNIWGMIIFTQCPLLTHKWHSINTMIKRPKNAVWTKFLFFLDNVNWGERNHMDHVGHMYIVTCDRFRHISVPFCFSNHWGKGPNKQTKKKNTLFFWSVSVFEPNDLNHGGYISFVTSHHLTEQRLYDKTKICHVFFFPYQKKYSLVLQ
jgi:hypothetical protein